MHGGDIYSRSVRIDFSTNINPLGTPASVLSAACEGVMKSAIYPDVQCRQLRMAVCERYNIPVEWIICGNGAADLIFGIVLAEKPKKALLISPCFSEYEHALRTVGCEIEFYECKRENDFLLQGDVLKRITTDLDMIFLCNPSNPTGLLIPDKLLLSILERAHFCGVRVVVDECFNEFLMQAELVSVRNKLKEIPELFLLSAFTKVYAMAGLRLGYGMCSDMDFIASIREVTQPWNVSFPAQMAGVAALKETTFVRESREYIARERVFMKKRLQKLGLRCYDSQVNYLFFEGPEDLYDKCLQEGILFRDCSDYRGLSKGDYRVAVRTRAENEELLRVVAEIIQKYKKCCGG